MALTAPTADLTGNKIADTYDQLLFLDNAAGIVENTLKIVSTQLGKSALQLDDEKVLIKGFGTSNAIAFEVQEGADATPYISIGTGTTTKGVTINESGQSDIDFRVEGSGAANALVVDGTNGKVGIGTDAPANPLHVVSPSGTATGLLIERTGSTENVAIGFKNTEGSPTNWFIGKSENGGFGISDGSEDLDSSANNRLYISSAGNVGIGTNAPIDKLNIVSGASGEYSTIYLGDNGADDQGTGLIYAGHNLILGTDNNIYLVADANDTSGTGVSDIVFGYGSDTDLQTTSNFPYGGALPRVTTMTIKSNTGRVGIGTTSPAHILEIEQAGACIVQLESTALTDTQAALFRVKGTGNSVDNYASIGVIYENGAETNAPTGYIRLDESEGDASYMWIANDLDVMVNATLTNVGKASSTGTVIGDQSSDERLKNISSDAFPYGLSEINQLTPIKYTLKSDGTNRSKLGFGAQTTEPIIPETVYDTGELLSGYTTITSDENADIQTPKVDGETDTRFAMKYVQIIPVLVKAVQELSAKVTALENA